MTVTPSPQEVRDRFVALLEEGKRSLADANRGTSDGPAKLLAAEIQISPSRLGNFLDWSFTVKVTKGRTSDLLTDPQIKRTVSGFAGSVHRTLAWLRRMGMAAGGLTTREVVKAYWPGHVLKEFELPAVGAAITEGENTAAGLVSKRTMIDIQLWVVNWGPFGTPDQNDDFFSCFGRALAQGIDPIESQITVVKKPLDDVLNFPASARRKGWSVAMGPFETLYRRFNGFKFVTFPAIRIPLVALLLSTRDAKRTEIEFRFETVLHRDFVHKRVVVDREVGHLVLSSMLPPHIRDDTERVECVPNKELRDVPDVLLDRTQESGTVLFLSDALLAFEIFARLSKEDIRVEVISQWDQNETSFLGREFVFAPGIMLREEDSEFGTLLDESQQQIFKSHWRVEEELLAPLFDGLETWLTKLRVSERALVGWGDTAPVFLFPRDDVDDYLKKVVRNDGKRNDLVNHICDWTKERCNGSAHAKTLSKLFKISPPESRL